MALTLEMLNEDETLKGLTDEQKSAVVTASSNDEDVVIGKRIGEIYRSMDDTIETSTGIERKGDEKTYNYLKRATEAYAQKYSDYDSIKESVEKLKAENLELEQRVAKGGDEALRSQYEASQRELESVKSQYTEMQEKLAKSEEDHKKAMSDYKIDTEISKAISEISIKPGLNDNVKKTLLSQAISNIKSKNPYFEDRNGENRLIFHESDGTPLINRENRLEPFTAKELLTNELEEMDLIDQKPATGAGGKGNPPANRGLGGISTQTEATEVITKELTDKGLLRGTSDFQKEFNRLWNEGKVYELPMK